MTRTWQPGVSLLSQDDFSSVSGHHTWSPSFNQPPALDGFTTRPTSSRPAMYGRWGMPKLKSLRSSVSLLFVTWARQTYGAFQSIGFSPSVSVLTSTSRSLVCVGIAKPAVCSYACRGPCSNSTFCVAGSAAAVVSGMVSVV